MAGSEHGEMTYRRLGKAGVEVSPICLGTAFRAHLDEAACERVIHQAIELGCNFIDCANSYGRGRSEEILGRAVKGKRDGLVLATKVWTPMGDGPNERGLSRYHIMSEVERSLRRLQTDRIDLYYLHSVDPDTQVDETLRAMEDLVRQGKVRYVGASNYRAWQVMGLLWTASEHDWQLVSCLQMPYNLLQRRDIEPEIAPLCDKYGLGLVAYSPLAVGLLTGQLRPDGELGRVSAWSAQRLRDVWTPSVEAVLTCLREVATERGCTCTQAALAWMLTRPFLTAPIIGPDLPEQVQEAFGALDVKLGAEQVERLNQVSQWPEPGLYL